MAVKKSEDPQAPDLPGFIFFIYAVVWFGILVYGVYRIPFGGPITQDEWWFAVPVVISWFGVGFLMLIVLELVKLYHKKAQLNRFVQSRNFLLWTIGWLGFFGFVPRVVVFFNYEWIMWYTVYVSLFGITFSYTLYVSILDSLCKINRSWTDGRSWILLLVHVAFLFSLCSYLDNPRFFNREHSAAIFLCHLGFSFVCAVASVEFSYVWRGEIRINLNPNERQQVDARFFELPPIPADQMQSEEFESTFKCEVCNKNYNPTVRTPRMLKECGHTVCEECAEDLLKKNNEQFLRCPYCDLVTLVNGPAAWLPKNAVIMDTMGPKSFKNPVEVV